MRCFHVYYQTNIKNCKQIDRHRVLTCVLVTKYNRESNSDRAYIHGTKLTPPTKGHEMSIDSYEMNTSVKLARRWILDTGFQLDIGH